MYKKYKKYKEDFFLIKTIDVDVAINLVDKLIYQQTNQHLNTMQIILLQGVWSNQTYEQIAEICHCSIAYIKFIGSALWKELSLILGEKVTKTNLPIILESYQQSLENEQFKKVLIANELETEYQDKTIDFPNFTFDLSTNQIPDSWFNYDILLKLTKRLNDLITIQSNPNITEVELLLKKLELIHSLSTKTFLNRDYFDIIKICHDLINSFKINFPNREIRLSLFENTILPGDNLMLNVLINEQLVTNILKELLLNSLQYSQAESSVIIDINIEDKKVIFSIIDQGIGIPFNELQQVFQPFYSATSTEQKSRDGLGLTIVQKSIRLHQGEIFVSSKINKGSTFMVVLPVA